jgi:hypothetical protein
MAWDDDHLMFAISPRRERSASKGGINETKVTVFLGEGRWVTLLAHMTCCKPW